VNKKLAGVVILLLLIAATWAMVAYISPKADLPEQGIVGSKAQGFADAFVIELKINATDSLPVQVLNRYVPTLSDEIDLDRKDNNYLNVSNRVFKAIREHVTDPSVKLGKGIDHPEDIKTVLIEFVDFTGYGRNGSSSTVYFSKKLVGFPKHSYADSFDLQIQDSLAKLNEIIPMPKKVTWHITKDGELELRVGSENRTLQAGDIFHFSPVKEKIPIKMSRYKPAKKGNIKDALKEDVVQQDLGIIFFSSGITIHFYGKLPLVER
jgi:hypothetical protein